MSGRLVLARDGSARPLHTHLVLALDDGSELRFIDPRRFGLAVPMAAESIRTYRPLAALGPDPLLEDCALALRSRRRSRVAIRNVLLDQRVIAGVGNIYANEALFRAGTHPATPARRLADRRIARLAAAIREVLAAAVSAGGTTLADGGFANADGEAGYFAVDLSVYGRAGLPCGRCGREIERLMLAGRSAYYCPGCQRR
jgi:formamidopyrimidine-DNA glycosylase